MEIGRLAPWYRWIEYAAFGRALERRRFAFLSRLAACRNVLVPGEGDGRALERLLALAPMAHFDVVEISPEMIALARRRTHDGQTQDGETQDSGRVVFRCEDARTVSWPAARYDAIVTLFFLDCFGEDDARKIIQRLAAALAPGGVWLIGEFAIPEHGWRRLHAQAWVRVMYRFFRGAAALRAQELPPIPGLMREAGMRCAEREEARAGLMVSEVWVHQER